MTLKFTRKIEDFVCENCGVKVRGNGFTNHCPHCLWSKHVDIDPGDRASDCQGLMKLIRVEFGDRDREYILVHRCVKCGYEKRNKTSENDNFEEIIKICKFVGNKL
ncbi:MAG: RNHCP domain-containing protein [Patescibacteria group bacterium]